MYTQLDSDIYRKAAAQTKNDIYNNMSRTAEYEYGVASNKGNIKQVCIRTFLRKSFICLIIIFIIYLLKNTTGFFSEYLVNEIKTQVIETDYAVPSFEKIEEVFNNSIDYLNVIK